MEEIGLHATALSAEPLLPAAIVRLYLAALVLIRRVPYSLTRCCFLTQQESKEDLYTKYKALERHLEFLDIQVRAFAHLLYGGS